jgi:Acetyltransferase (GNAT) domain
MQTKQNYLVLEAQSFASIAVRKMTSGQLHNSLTVKLIDSASLDYDEFVSFQRRAFANISGIVRPNTIQTIPYYRWKYRTPWGPAKLAIAAINGDMAAGVAAIPWPLTDGVNERSGWQICDIATHPHRRHQGLFRRCLGELLSSLPTNSVVFCFPNRQSFPPLVGMGFVQTGALRLWVSISPLLGMGRNNGLEKTWNFNGLLPIKAPTPGTFQTRVDNLYLEWRFVRRPEHEYRSIGTSGHGGEAIVRSLVACGQKISILMMLTAEDAAAVSALLYSAIFLESRRGARAMLYLDSHWRGSLKPLFFPLASWMAPRTFPIVATGLKGASLRLRTCDWDVL